MRSLRWLRGPDISIDAEIKSIQDNMSRSSTEKSSLKELLNIRYLKPLLISLGLMLFQQLSGINAVIFYTVSIFEHAGSSMNSNLSTVIIGVVNILSTFVANILIDRLGRKVLLLISTVFMFLSLISLGTYFYLKEVLSNEDKTGEWKEIVNDLGWLPLVSLMTYVVAFSLGWGPLPWLFVGEGLPNKVRGPGGSLVTVCNWTCGFLVTKTFPGMVSQLGAFGVFFMFACIMFLALLFTIFIFPETKGKSLEEIEEILTGKNKQNRNNSSRILKSK